MGEEAQKQFQPTAQDRKTQTVGFLHTKFSIQRRKTL